MGLVVCLGKMKNNNKHKKLFKYIVFRVSGVQKEVLRVAILSRLVWLHFTGDSWAKAWKRWESQPHKGPWSKSIFGRRPSSAKALRREFVRSVWRTAMRPMWLEWNWWQRRLEVLSLKSLTTHIGTLHFIQSERSRWVTWSNIFERIPLAAVVKIDLGKGFKIRNGKSSWKSIKIIWERDFSDLDHSGNSGEGEKRLNSGYVLKVEPIWFSGRLDVVSSKRSMTCGLLVWATGKMKLPWTGMVAYNQELSFGAVILRWLLD